MTQDIRPLQILLLNLMPTKIATETQLSRLLSNTPLQVELELIAPRGHVPKNTPQEHMLAFYRHFDDVRSRNCLPPDDGVPGVGDHEDVVTAPEEHVALSLHHMVEDAEELLLQGHLGDAVVVVEPRLGPPADVEGRVDMAFGPLHDLAELLPVLHLLEGQVLHRRAGDDEAVEVPAAHVVEVAVEGEHMLLGGVLSTPWLRRADGRSLSPATASTTPGLWSRNISGTRGRASPSTCPRTTTPTTTTPRPPG